MAFVSGLASLRGSRYMMQRAISTAPRGVRWKMTATYPPATKSDANPPSAPQESYKVPPKEILDLVDAELDPSVILQPALKKVMLMLKKPTMPSIAQVAAPELRLAGYRINATTYGPSRADYFLDMKFQMVDDPERKQLPIDNLPFNQGDGKELGIGSIHWSPDGSKIAFSTHDPLFGFELWCIDVDERRAWSVAKGARLNSVGGDSFSWLCDSQRLIVKFVQDGLEPPVRNFVPKAPIVEESDSGIAKPSRTYQDLLKDQHDVELFKHFTTSQLEIVDVVEGTRRKIGDPAPFRRAVPSPDGKYILVDMMKEPFSYLLPASRFGRSVEIWDVNTGESVALVADIPLQDNIPLSFDGVGAGPRNIGWRTDVDSTIYWVEAQDGGNPAVEADIRDAMFVLPAPFARLPRRLALFEWRFSGVIWGDSDTALVLERWYKTRSIRTHLINPGEEQSAPGAEADGPCCERACDSTKDEAPSRLLIDVKNWEDRYNDPGSVLTMANARGRPVLRKVYPAGAENKTPFLLVQSSGASEEGDKPHLALMDSLTGKKKIIWQSTPPFFENVVNIMETDEKTGEPRKLMIRRETPEENPNLYIVEMPDNLFADEKPRMGHAVTAFPHPAIQLKDVRKEIVTYMREDGVKLNASLYLPVGFDKERDGPLKMFMWAYPREFKSATFAGQMRDSPYRFTRLARTPLYWLTRGYAILDGPLMPVIGEGDAEPNDTYIEQLVASAKAAVKYVVDEGIAHPKQIAIGGHSYGAFMTVTLLAHTADLFCCGIARSGAYNRTLTPFGFQAEERTLWQVPEVYQNMSPYLAADNISVPVLLIHGEADNNPGTFPVQSDRLFQALKGMGKRARYVLLPAEGHGYRARESTLHVLREMTDWLDAHCEHQEVPSAKL